jgi:hypothetical protein
MRATIFSYRSPAPYSVLPFRVLVLLSRCLFLSCNTVYYSLAVSTFLTILYTTLSLSLPFLQYYILLSRCLFLCYNTVYYSLAVFSFLTILYTILSLSLPLLQYCILFFSVSRADYIIFFSFHRKQSEHRVSNNPIVYYQESQPPAV